MCIIALAHRASSRYRLIVAANRDEAHARPTRPATWWEDVPLLAGRDVTAGGTWLGVDRRLRLAAVTNLREPVPSPPARSRGLLVRHFVAENVSAAEFTQALATAAYAPFHLLVYDGDGLCYASNRASPRALPAGVHAVSNAEPGVEWPKMARAHAGLTTLLEHPSPEESLFELLAERHVARDGYDARQVSLFLNHPIWGTRSSTVILVGWDGAVRFTERSFDAAGALSGEVTFAFRVASVGRPVEAARG